MTLDPASWGLTRRGGRLCLDGHDLVDLADRFGTPVHVASAARLRDRADELLGAFARWSGGVEACFSYKTNTVAGILRVLHARGLGAEVVDGYELHLALRLGVPADRIVFNGPNKTDAELSDALAAEIGLLVVDNLAELERLEGIARRADRTARIGLRICPDVVPRRTNASSLTGSRRNQFGLDLPGGEWDAALARVSASEHLDLRAVTAHVGSGIHDLSAFRSEVEVLLDRFREALDRGCRPDRIDLGGGLGTRLSRELTTLEMLAYLGVGRLPRLGDPPPEGLARRYADVVIDALEVGCARRALPPPRLVLEPGRALVSDAQVLLLRVGAVRDRPGVGRFALTDGGAMTVSLMFLSELHAVLLADRDAPEAGRISVFGRLPSPMDVVYRNLPMPALRSGDVLAVMDAGAYFTSTATNFGGPRPGVLLVDDDVTWARRPETFDDLLRLEGPFAEPHPADAGGQAPNRTHS